MQGPLIVQDEVKLENEEDDVEIEVEKEEEEKDREIEDEEEEIERDKKMKEKKRKEEEENGLKDDDKYDLMKNKIQPRMKDIAKWSLMCASEAIEHRNNSWELYGFDYMIDDDYNAWLIEINSSPACDYSTATTSKYVQKALVELLSVVLDVRQYENNLKSNPKQCKDKYPDTGGWENIFKGVTMDMPVAAFGTDMTLKGEAMKLPKKQNNTSGTGFSQGGGIPQGSGLNGGGGSHSEESRLKKIKNRIPSSSSLSKTKQSSLCSSSSTSDDEESQDGVDDADKELSNLFSADPGPVYSTGMTLHFKIIYLFIFFIY